MKTSIVAIAVALAALSVPALATDLIVDVPDGTVVDDSFDWEGAYIGGFAGAHLSFLAGGEIGYNFLPSDMLLLGINASGFIDGTGDTELWLDGKLGAAWDNFALYGTAGVGLYNVNLPIWRVGVGAEVAVTDSVTLNGQVGLDDVVGAVPSIPYGLVGVRFHF